MKAVSACPRLAPPPVQDLPIGHSTIRTALSSMPTKSAAGLSIPSTTLCAIKVRQRPRICAATRADTDIDVDVDVTLAQRKIE
jgi:hypothetical protein